MGHVANFRTRTLVRIISVLALAGAFALVTIFVVEAPNNSLDLAISRAVQELACPFLSWLMMLVSWIGTSPQFFIVSIGIVVAIFVADYRWEATVLLIAGTGDSLLNLLLKALIQRPRPSPELVTVLDTLSDFSFPSGHVMFYTGFFGFICFFAFSVLKTSLIRTALLGICGVEVALVGISRIYLGAHWASDVVGGYLAGTICLLGALYLYRWRKPSNPVMQSEK